MILARAHLMLAVSFGTRPAPEIVARIAEDEADQILLRLQVSPACPSWARVVTDVRRAVAIQTFEAAGDAVDLEGMIRAAARTALAQSIRRRSPDGARIVPVGASLEIELDGAFGFARVVSITVADAA
jgi:hypothetical protein